MEHKIGRHDSAHEVHPVNQYTYDDRKTTSEYASECIHGRNGYITYYKGDKDSKIILTVPHGGDGKPSHIKDRALINKTLSQPLKICNLKDMYTLQLAAILRQEIISMTSRKPHMIICNLHRTKIDANRERYLATFDQPDALLAFEDFHSFIEIAKGDVKEGILFDIHGHTHKENLVELGYCLKNCDISQNIFKADCCSIKSLIERSNFEVSQLINGDKSFGYFLQQEGVECVPSPKIPSTLKNCYTGGFNTRHHGSMRGGRIDAIQIESPKIYRNKESAPEYAKHLARAICSFMKVHYIT